MTIKPTYVPILKWKKGQQLALKALNTRVKDEIIPLIEITPEFKEEFIERIERLYWGKRYFYFYVLPECYEENKEVYFNILKQLNRDYFIPVLNLHTLDADILKAHISSKNGIALRFNLTDFNIIESIKRVLNIVTSDNLDLIIDLRSIKNGDEINKKVIEFERIVYKIQMLGEFRNIILAGSSMVKRIINIPRNELVEKERYEWKLFIKARKKISSKYKINIVYSDYCISKPEYESDKVENIPRGVFNIKYTTENSFVILKGDTLWNEDNIINLCGALVNSKNFNWPLLSWGDKYIYEHSTKGQAGYGNKSTWVKACTNHHISFVVKELKNIK